MTHAAATHTHDPDPPSGEGAWTQERVELLLALHDQKMGRSDIAITINNRTGSNFSRGAICGKIDRLLPDNARKLLTPEQKAANRRASVDAWNAKRRERARQRRIELGMSPDAPSLKSRKVQPFTIVTFDPAAFRNENIRGLANLADNNCHYPINDDMTDPLYCGLPTLRGRYCAGHYHVCYAPVQSRSARAAQ